MLFSGASDRGVFSVGSKTTPSNFEAEKIRFVKGNTTFLAPNVLDEWSEKEQYSMVENGHVTAIVNWELITFSICLEHNFVACLILSPNVYSTTPRDIRLFGLRCAGIKDTQEYCSYWPPMPLGISCGGQQLCSQAPRVYNWALK